MLRLSVCLLAACVAVVSAIPLSPSNDELVVTTSTGPIRGVYNAGERAFYDIPYAQPPVGDLRWKQPVPVTPWSDIKNTTEQGPVCAQLRIFKDIITGSEDCLTLDVYTPKEADITRPLPVMVYLHGGAFIFGNKNKYDGVGLAQKYGAVVVIVQYRLDLFGFYAIDALKAEDKDKSVGNYGLQDQQLAMKWAKANAKTFGGDPDHIMLFGESAGAISVCAHFAMPASKGLFTSAVMESGTCDAPEFFFDEERDVRFGMEYAGYVGCKGDGNAVLDCMRSKKTSELMVPILQWLKREPKWSPDAPPLAPVFTFGPTVDGSDAGLPQLPLHAIETKTAPNLVPTIIGTNADEGTIFAIAVPLIVPKTTYPLTKKGLSRSLSHLFPNASTDAAIEAEYPAKKGITVTDATKRVADIVRDYVFVCASRRALRALTAAGVPAWSYEFTYKLHDIKGKIFGDYHAAEIPFVFQEYAKSKHQSDKDLEFAFGEYWSNLAEFNTPNRPHAVGSDKLIDWPAYSEHTTTTTDSALLFTEPLAVAHDVSHDICDFWDKIDAESRH